MVLLFLLLRPRDTGDMRRMVGLGAAATACWALLPEAGSDTGRPRAPRAQSAKMRHDR
jgi:hypothetical protein